PRPHTKNTVPKALQRSVVHIPSVHHDVPRGLEAHGHFFEKKTTRETDGQRMTAGAHTSSARRQPRYLCDPSWATKSYGLPETGGFAPPPRGGFASCTQSL